MQMKIRFSENPRMDILDPKHRRHCEQPLITQQRNVPCLHHEPLSDREQSEIPCIPYVHRPGVKEGCAS